MSVLAVFLTALTCSFIHVPLASSSTTCLHCTNVTSISSCTATTTCTSAQQCSTIVTGTLGSPRYTLGCQTTSVCNSWNATGAAVVVGKREATAVSERAVTPDNTCQECCSGTKCNGNLCSCMNDPTHNCPGLQSLINICSDIHHAKRVCRKYCNLCKLVDGGWSAWSSWSDCSVTCENGHNTRTRTCTNPPPSKSPDPIGLNCNGSAAETKVCHIATMCPVDGGWSTWSSWEPCSVTCGTGIRRRQRSCTAPIPAYEGHVCFGDTHDYGACHITACDHDGGWTAWGDWGPCSGNCSFGIKEKARNCTSPAPSGTGHACIGNSIVYTSCFDTYHCPTSTTQLVTKIPSTVSTLPPPTTRQPEATTAGCQDRIDCRRYDRNTTCTQPAYSAWAHHNCAAYCDFCTPATVTPIPCVNKLGNCGEYDDGSLCTSQSFAFWAQDNCYAYCGFGPCGPSTQSTAIPTLVTTVAD